MTIDKMGPVKLSKNQEVNWKNSIKTEHRT